MRLRRLQARLLVWFLAAILLAVGASVLTTFLTSSDPGETPTRVVSRHVQHRLARLWDDPVATEAYVAELRDTTGLDMRVRRDPALFSGRRGRGQNGMIFEDGVAYVPVVKGGVVVGALELRTGSPAPQLWRVAVALAAALLVLGLVARRVSKRLARPLEHLAQTAERFGSGDLAARTGIEKLPRRWVAEEVRDVGQAFDTMADRIARVVLEQRELLAAISHELRSPLGRARVALEIARERIGVTSDDGAGVEGGADAEDASPAPPVETALAGRALDDVDRQLVEIDAILGDLLASARASLADVRLEPVALRAWLEQRMEAEGTGRIEVVAEELDAGLRVPIDPALLGRALHNVLANAWAHGHPKDVPLVVTASATDELVRVGVRDRGPGFAADILPRAFDPFVTGTGAARSPGAHGIGLGLSLVRRIVEAHGGRVSAENVEEDGRPAGAIVAFELSRVAPAKEREASPGSSSRGVS
ncbi:MAG: HAMP domain-containing histidine kinase [Labilithrix sp.]|nr:HAMP domain-containing histidine kinase [Labilithrix sp.]